MNDMVVVVKETFAMRLVDIFSLSCGFVTM